MRVVQRSARRIRVALLSRQVGDPKLAHHGEVENVFVRGYAAAIGCPLVSKADEQVPWVGRPRAKEFLKPSEVRQQPNSVLGVGDR